MKLLVLASVFVAAAHGSTQSYTPPIHSYGGSGLSGGSSFGGGFSSGGGGFSSGGGGFSSGGGGFIGGGGFSGESVFVGGGGGGFSSGGGGFIGGGGFSSGGGGFSSGGSGFSGGSCGPGEVLNVDGSCATPVVTRNLFLFEAPPTSPIVGPRPQVPPPRVEHNVLFIRTSDVDQNVDPVIVPPTQQKNIVYVLNKRPELQHQVIHLPEPEQDTPEVFFVNYAEGDNPTLPTGEDLQSALSIAAQSSGDVISGDSGFIGGGGSFVGGGVGVGVGGIGGGVGGSYSPPHISSTPLPVYS